MNRQNKGYFALAAALAFLLLSGCAGGGQKPIRIQKADAQVEELVSTASAEETAKIDPFPARLERTFTSEDGAVTISIDAALEAPEVPLPSVAVTSRRLTATDAAAIIAALSEDGKLYADSKDHPSAERIASRQAGGNALLAAIQAHPEEFNMDARLISSGAYERSIKALNEELATAAPLSSFASAFSGDRQSGQAIDTVSGGFLRGGQYYALTIQNGSAGGAVFCSHLQDDPVNLKMMQPYRRIYHDAGADIVGLSYAASLALTQEIVNGFGAGDLALGSATVVEYPNAALPGYDQFTFVRQVNGVPVGADRALLAEDVYNAGVADAAYAETLPYESLVVCVDAKGLLRLQWVSPMTVERVISEHTALLPLDDVLACFGKMVFVKSASAEQLGWQNDGGGILSGVKTNVERVRLSLMRIESGGDYLLIPVWDFYGFTEYFDQNGAIFSFATTQPNSEYTEYGKKGEEEVTSSLQKTEAERDYNRMLERQTSLITINAIDGTIIDRLTGY